MRKLLLAAVAALAVASAPAMAQGIAAGQVGGSFTYNQGNQSGSTHQGSFTFNGSGNAVGSSASGFNATFGAAGPAAAATFSSVGQSSSATGVTPFSVTTQSQHSGAFATNTLGNAFVSGTVQTFGQSNGASAFNVKVTDSFKNWSNQQSSLTAGLGFTAFGAFAF